MLNQQRQQRSSGKIRQDYLKQAMESAIPGSSKYSNEVSSEGSGGDETYRVARDSMKSA